jgi:alpha-tubulin suppressor-like RCC1 family protein
MGTNWIVAPLLVVSLAPSLPGPAHGFPHDSLTFASVTAGATHTCALTTGGRAYCWGSNAEGELGTGTRVDSPLPAPVGGNLVFLNLDAGVEFTCGVTSSGATYCWGRNSTGALGNAATPRSTTPLPVTGGLLFRSVTAGNDHACGVAEDGVAYCWGANAEGQLGTGDTLSSARPLPVAGTLRFRSVTAGDAHTCGITVDSLAYCWGANRRGELGIGERGARLGPQAVVHHRRWEALSAGARHTCGTTAERHSAVLCWGDNFHEQINPRRSPLILGASILWMPTYATQPRGPVVVSAGRWHTCIVHRYAFPTVSCRGANFDDQLGQSILGKFVQVSAGDAHSCALREDGAVYCWGRNASGQLGDGTRYSERRPVRIAEAVSLGP